MSNIYSQVCNLELQIRFGVLSSYDFKCSPPQNIYVFILLYIIILYLFIYIFIFYLYLYMHI